MLGSRQRHTREVDSRVYLGVRGSLREEPCPASQVPPERGSLDRRQGHRRDRIVRTPTLGRNWNVRVDERFSYIEHGEEKIVEFSFYWPVSLIFTTYTLYCRRHRHTKEYFYHNRQGHRWGRVGRSRFHQEFSPRVVV